MDCVPVRKTQTIETYLSALFRLLLVERLPALIIQIHGYKKDPSNSLTDVTISIVRPSAITTGTDIENIAGNPLVYASHFQEFILGVGNGFSSYYSTTNPLSVSITAISVTSVKGTFQGELEGLNLNGDTTTIALTNGVFHVSF